jgi:hypothetical protein
MATKQKTPTGPLTPTVVRNETQAMDHAVESGRKRPFVAINDDGKLVVCSRRTAAKYGWEAQGALYSRNGNNAAPAKKSSSKQTTEAAWKEATSRNKDAAPTSNVVRAVRRAVRAEFAALTTRNPRNRK